MIPAAPINYHELPEGFLKWAILVLITVPDDDPATKANIEAIKAPPGLTTLTITMQINGVEVDALHLLKRLEESRDHSIRQEAMRILTEETDLDVFSNIVTAGTNHIKNQLTAAGVHVDREY